jgi:kynurenine formamidase
MDGIVTRGVLYDIPLLRGVPYIPANEPVQGWELEDFAKLKNIQPEKGDAVIINFGRNEYFKVNPNAPNTGNKKPGLNPSVLDFLDAYEVALLGSEFDEAINTEYSATFPIHSIANPYMGLPTLWHLDLQRLAKDCEERNTWEFYVIIAPLIVTGGTGSVVNPIAIL